MNETAAEAGSGNAALNPDRLFLGSCVALVATSVAFATVSAIMFSLKGEFVLTNADVGWIAGAAIWGFAVSQVVFAPLCDNLGMRWLLRMAFAGHLAGTILMIFAGGFVTLFLGALVIAMANGLVEAACNPLVAALYPDNKTVKLNRFHVWFPGGIVLGGLAAFGLDEVGLTSWQLKLALILIPTLAYGWLLLGQQFPQTEGRRSGVSMGEMFRATLGTPLMLLLLVCMAMTASLELGPNRWVPAVLEAGGLAGILVLVYINGIMAVLRFWAGPVVHRLSPTGILLASAAISGVGLFWLSGGGTAASTFAAATVFAVGVCYLWPTMLGFVSEQIPKSGALGLGLMGTVGMATVGLATTPWMGEIADRESHDLLVDNGAFVVLLEGAGALESQQLRTPGPEGDDLRAAQEVIVPVLETAMETDTLPPVETANALRALIGSGSTAPSVERAEAILYPAENYGGLVSFRYLVPLSGVLVVVFGLMFVRQRRAGGYRAERLA
ncbi:MAG: MFS transporter [Gemmatimonadetes bacterium]|nr:MFS transporter [Gemmatimonadota bacterium]MYE16942.1 MFS transporter [Gemmatimonadota bacterium]